MVLLLHKVIQNTCKQFTFFKYQKLTCVWAMTLMTLQYFFIFWKSLSISFLPCSSCHFLEDLVKAFFLERYLEGGQNTHQRLDDSERSACTNGAGTLRTPAVWSGVATPWCTGTSQHAAMPGNTGTMLWTPIFLSSVTSIRGWNFPFLFLTSLFTPCYNIKIQDKFYV